MLAGRPYRADDPELQADQAATLAWLGRYNTSHNKPPAYREALLAERLAAVGEGAIIRLPFHYDHGFNIRIGAGASLNFNCVILDVVAVTIGDRTQIGPAVPIFAADHPRDAATRRLVLEFGRPVHIGADVWTAGGTVRLPGVTVGDGAIIGAGSVMTHDVLPGSTVTGDPARPLVPRWGG